MVSSSYGFNRKSMKSGPGRAEAQNDDFLIRIYSKINEIWTWAGGGPKCWFFNKVLLENRRPKMVALFGCLGLLLGLPWAHLGSVLV